MPGEKVLIIDDERDIGEIIGIYLTEEGFLHQQAVNGVQSLQMVETFAPHLIILDVFLPDIDGYELCQKLRAVTNVPILFLTCKDSEMDRVIGLSVGGDDYLSKPFGPAELVARIKAHLRRSRMVTGTTSVSANTLLVSQSLQVNLLKHEVRVDGHLIELSAKEFQLLTFFMNHPFQVLTSEHLLRHIWGYHIEVDTKTLQVHIGTLRKKIEADSTKPLRIITLRGVGYKFCEHAEAI